MIKIGPIIIDNIKLISNYSSDFSLLADYNMNIHYPTPTGDFNFVAGKKYHVELIHSHNY